MPVQCCTCDFFSPRSAPHIAAPHARSPRSRRIPAIVLYHFSLIDPADSRLCPAGYVAGCRLYACSIALCLDPSICGRPVCGFLTLQPWTGRGLPRWCGQVRPTPATACSYVISYPSGVSADLPVTPPPQLNAAAYAPTGAITVPVASSLQRESIVQSWPLHAPATRCVNQQGQSEHGTQCINSGTGQDCCRPLPHPLPCSRASQAGAGYAT